MPHLLNFSFIIWSLFHGKLSTAATGKKIEKLLLAAAKISFADIQKV
jgi:hypothetical protein